MPVDLSVLSRAISSFAHISHTLQVLLLSVFVLDLVYASTCVALVSPTSCVSATDLRESIGLVIRIDNSASISQLSNTRHCYNGQLRSQG